MTPVMTNHSNLTTMALPDIKWAPPRANPSTVLSAKEKKTTVITMTNCTKFRAVMVMEERFHN